LPGLRLTNVSRVLGLFKTLPVAHICSVEW